MNNFITAEEAKRNVQTPEVQYNNLLKIISEHIEKLSLKNIEEFNIFEPTGRYDYGWINDLTLYEDYAKSFHKNFKELKEFLTQNGYVVKSSDRFFKKFLKISWRK